MNQVEAQFQHHIPIDPDKETRSIFLHPGQMVFTDAGIIASVQEANETYKNDRLGTFERQQERNFITESGVVASFAHDARVANATAVNIEFSPLNDGVGESEPEVVFAHIESDGETPRAMHARPNSHRPSSKSNMVYETRNAEGIAIPTLKIYAPEASMMTAEQRRRVAKGDMTVYGEIAEEALAHALEILKNEYGNTSVNELHFSAAGMGAKALGAAAYFAKTSDKFSVGSLDLMNLSVGDQSTLERASTYAGRKLEGDESKLILPDNFKAVKEFDILTDLDKKTELAMRIRQAKALKNFLMVSSIMNARQANEYIELILDDNKSVITIGNGLNEPMTRQTPESIPRGEQRIHFVDIVGVEGKKVGMASNEVGVALAALNVIALKNYHNHNLGTSWQTPKTASDN